MTRYLIVGNGVAADSAVEVIRKTDDQGPITMCSRESVPFYYRPALPEYLSGERQIKDFTLHDKGWYEKKRIDLHLNTEITAIDHSQRNVCTREGKTFHYDKLLLATGGSSFVPPIKGSEVDGVCTLRTIDDADAIREKAKRSKNLIVIGGGLLGLEAGNGLRKTGIKVSVVEFFPRLLPRQMDVPGAAILQKQMEGMGFTFYLGCRTQEIAREDKRLCVSLEGGEGLYADMVLLISAGVRPEITLAKAMGLEIDKAVKVDDTMKTSMEDTYAAGDLVEHRGRYYGIWPAAREQGRVAGANMAGKAMTYEGTIPSNKLKVAGIDLFAAGDIDADNTGESIMTKDEAGYIYRKLVLKDNVIVGAILLGDTRGDDAIQNAIRNKSDISQFRGSLADRNFDFSRLG